MLLNCNGWLTIVMAVLKKVMLQNVGLGLLAWQQLACVAAETLLAGYECLAGGTVYGIICCVTNLALLSLPSVCVSSER